MDSDNDLRKPLVVAILLALFGALLLWRHSAVEEQIRLEQLAKIAKQSTYYFPPELVIPYDAYVCQDSNSRKKPKCKWYVSATTRKEIK